MRNTQLTNMLKTSSALLFLLFAAIASVRSRPLCSDADEQALKQRHIQAVRASILAQLGLVGPPPLQATSEAIPPEVVENFRAVSQLTNLIEEEREKTCQPREYFAKPITSFIGSLDSDKHDITRRIPQSAEATGKSFQERSVLLNQYILSFNFSLEKNLSYTTQSSLFLFQTPAPKVNVYIKDTEQYVEVKSLSNAAGVSSNTVISGQILGIFGAGYQALDITSTVKLWSSVEMSGKITLQVSVYCISSPDCSEPDSHGRMPESVVFDHDQSSGKKAPRIVVTSKSPLELLQKNQAKRDLTMPPPPEGMSFCMINQSTCCLKELIINFEQDLGPEYSFIIDPPSFQANYCEGICPIIHGGEVLTPSLYQFTSRLQNHPAASIVPCCTGHAYKSLLILVNLSGIVVTRMLENVVVVSCRCV